MDIKVTLFDAADLEKMKQAFPPAFAKAVEDAIYRGVTRAIRVALHEGWIQALAKPEVKIPAPEPPPAPEPEPPPPTEQRAKARDVRKMREVLKTVADRPHGFITTDEAAELLNGAGMATKWLVGQWLLNKEVEGVIVANYTPPTKGCPGRVFVNKDSLLNRERERTIARNQMGEGHLAALRAGRERRANGPA